LSMRMVTPACGSASYTSTIRLVAAMGVKDLPPFPLPPPHPSLDRLNLAFLFALHEFLHTPSLSSHAIPSSHSATLFALRDQPCTLQASSCSVYPAQACYKSVRKPAVALVGPENGTVGNPGRLLAVHV
jgi:hypothetical protein